MCTRFLDVICDAMNILVEAGSSGSLSNDENLHMDII